MARLLIMLQHPNIDHVAFHVFGWPIYWYGISYLVGFVLCYLLLKKRLYRYPNWNADKLTDLLFYGTLGVLLGGRIGYTLLYNFQEFIQNPLWLFNVRQGGMSFHGGLMGVILAVMLFCRKYKDAPFAVLDYVAPAVPIGLGLGRIANFINGELYGRVTDPSFPFAMIFPSDPEQLPRHPSQLYQALGEGLILFVVLWLFSLKPRPRYAVSGLFLIVYGIARFSVEFVRQPDANAGFILWGWMTKGQLYTIPMIAFGLFLMMYAQRQRLYDWSPNRPPVTSA